MLKIITLLNFFPLLIALNTFASDPLIDSPLMSGFSSYRGNSIDYLFQPSFSSSSPPQHSPFISENLLRVTYYPFRKVDSSSAPSSILRDTWSFTSKISSIYINETVTIPAPQNYIPTVVVPRNLWDVELTGRYNHTYEGHQNLGMSLTVGSASDEPFHGMGETIFQVNGSYRFPVNETDQWMFFLNWTNNRSFLNYIPLPAVGYFTYSPTNKIQTLIGAPFAFFMYNPTPDWAFRTIVMMPNAASMELAYTVMNPLQAYISLNWGQQIWLRAARKNLANRLFFDQKRIQLGMRSHLSASLTADLSVGYSLARRFYETRSVQLEHSSEGVDLSNAWYVQAKLGFYQW